jgi:hypothetical protein
LWAVCLSGAPALAQDAPPAVLSAAELRARLTSAADAVRSVYAVYRADMTGPGSARDLPAGSYIYRTVAARSPGYFYHHGAHGHDHLDWRDDPLQKRIYVETDRWYLEKPLDRLYSGGRLKPGDKLPGSTPSEVFFVATGVWPLDQRPAPRFQDKEPFMLRDVGKCDQYSFVRPQQEQLDGHWCHVLERPGIDRLWLDVDRGCAVLAREVRNADTGAAMLRFELGGHREASPGIWLPGWIRNIEYDHEAKTAEGQQRRVKDGRLKVLEVRVNQTDEDFFVFRPPPGAIRVDRKGRPSQTVSGGLDHLDNLARWVREHAWPDAAPAAGWSAAWPLAAAACTVLACEAWLWWRRRRRLTVPARRP